MSLGTSLPEIGVNNLWAPFLNFNIRTFLYGDDAKCVGLFALRELNGS